MSTVVQAFYKSLKNDAELRLDLNGRSVNERNFDTLVQAMSSGHCKLKEMDLSYNPLFKD